MRIHTGKVKVTHVAKSSMTIHQQIALMNLICPGSLPDIISSPAFLAASVFSNFLQHGILQSS